MAEGAPIAGRGLQSWLELADELCDKGLYFEAHEELEAGWREATGDSRILLQGVIQIAAGLHRLRASPEKPEGGRYLLERGLRKLEWCSELLSYASLSRALAAVKPYQVSGLAPKRLTLRLKLR